MSGSSHTSMYTHLNSYCCCLGTTLNTLPYPLLELDQNQLWDMQETAYEVKIHVYHWLTASNQLEHEWVWTTYYREYEISTCWIHTIGIWNMLGWRSYSIGMKFILLFLLCGQKTNILCAMCLPVLQPTQGEWMLQLPSQLGLQLSQKQLVYWTFACSNM